MEGINKIICGDALIELKKLPNESIDCVITSPPYWALRDYGIKEQLGLETTFQEYIFKLCDIFDEVRRVLKNEGTCWVNIGDTYYSDYGGANEGKVNPEQVKQLKSAGRNKTKAKELPQSCLTLIGSRFAIEMIRREWILRNEIIWYKPNAMPSSAENRFSVDFEKVFFFVKNKKYYFEQQLEKSLYFEIDKRAITGPSKGGKAISGRYAINKGSAFRKDGMKNKRCVWKINTHGFPEAHFATFPQALCEIPIKAGCPPNGIVLDPFMGSGSVAVIARHLNRNWLGIELNPAYIKLAEDRLRQEMLPL